MVRHSAASVKAITLLALLLVIGIPCYATVLQAAGYTARVRLEVSAQGQGTSSGIVQSYLSRALRKLDGVVIVDDDPEFSLSVVVLETRNKRNEVIGYAISSVGTSLWQKSTLDSLASTFGVSDSQKSLFYAIFDQQGVVSHHLLQVGGDDALEQLCSQLVAEYDSNVLESSRKLYQKMQDMQYTPPKP